MLLRKDLIKVLRLEFNSGNVAVKKEIHHKAPCPLNVLRTSSQLKIMTDAVLEWDSLFFLGPSQINLLAGRPVLTLMGLLH